MSFQRRPQPSKARQNLRSQEGKPFDSSGAEVKDFYGIFSAPPCPLRLIWSPPPRPASGRVAVLSVSHETQRAQSRGENSRTCSFGSVETRSHRIGVRIAPVEVESDLHASTGLHGSCGDRRVGLMLRR